jgi:hypothetical protein
MTTRVAETGISHPMPVNHRGFLNWEEFEQRFRQAFGREMTGNERRWFQLALMGEEDSEEAQQARSTTP